MAKTITITTGFIRAKINEFKREMEVMIKFPAELTISNIEKRTEELNELASLIQHSKESRQLQQIVSLYDPFFKAARNYILTFGLIEKIDNIEEFILRAIGRIVKKHHYPAGYISYGHVMPPLISLKYKIPNLTITVEASTDFPQCDPSLLKPGKKLEELREKILAKITRETTSEFTLEYLHNKTFTEQIIIIEILGQLPENKLLIKTPLGFKVIESKEKTGNYKTEVYKIARKNYPV